MELSEMMIQYVGFHPSDYTRDYLQNLISEIYSESPDGANVQAVFSRQGHNFRARIRIDSAAGHFFAVASGRQFKDVTHRMVFQIRKKLDKWKTSRHEHRSISEVPYHFGPEESPEEGPEESPTQNPTANRPAVPISPSKA
jgi:hypothetical protein